MRVQVPSWLKYAAVEFTGSFDIDRKRTRNRDLVRMFAFIVLLITLLSVMSAMYRGLVSNFADSILGYTPGAGVPVRLSVDTSLSSSGDLQRASSLFRNSATIGGTEQPTPGSSVAGYDFHPFVEIERGSVFRLPESSWNTDAGQPGFSGWAVSADSPLWLSMGLTEDAAQTTLVASRAAFAVSFERDAYIAMLERAIADDALADWLARNPAGTQPQTLFVEVPFRPGLWRYHEFELVWVDSLPSVQRIAFLATLQLYEPLGRVLARDPLFAVMPGTAGEAASSLVARLDLEDVDRLGDSAGAVLDAFSVCMGTSANPSVEQTTFDAFISFGVPQAPASVHACIDSVGMKPNLRISTHNYVAGVPALDVTRDSMVFSCASIPEAGYSARADLADCANGAETVSLPIFSGFITGFAYVEDAGLIEEFVRAVDQAKVGDRAALFISELYRSSINRFRYLVHALDYVKLPIAAFFLFIALYTISTGTGMFFASRRINYGVLMARGMNSAEIRSIVYSQFLACFALAAAFSFGLVLATKSLVQFSFEGAAPYRLAQTELGVQQPRIVDAPGSADLSEVLLHTFSDVGISALTILAMIILVLSWQMWRLPLRRDTYPMVLIANSN